MVAWISAMRAGIITFHNKRDEADWVPVGFLPTSQLTPVVVAGVMYVTSANECWALDAGSGRSTWHYQRRRTRGIGGTAAGGVNRGVAVAGDNAHLIALDRSAGTLQWDTEMADWRQNN